MQQPLAYGKNACVGARFALLAARSFGVAIFRLDPGLNSSRYQHHSKPAQ